MNSEVNFYSILPLSKRVSYYIYIHMYILYGSSSNLCVSCSHQRKIPVSFSEIRKNTKSPKNLEFVFFDVGPPYVMLKL